MTSAYRLRLRLLQLGGALVLSWQSALAGVPAGQAIALSAAQLQSLGIETAVLGTRASSELGGLAAEVVVPNNQMYVVAAPLAGLLERIPVAANASVRSGQTLARIASPMLAELQRAYVQASVQTQLAGDNLQRDEALFADGIIAESRLRATRGQHVEARAVLAERRQALRLAGVPDASLGKPGAAVDVVAPADGVILEQLVAIGARVEAAAPMFRLAKLDPLWLEIQVPVAVLPRVRAGSAVAVSAAQASGRVVSVGRSVDANQTVRVRAEIAQGAARLTPGQMVEAAIVLGEGRQDSVFSVPAAALVRMDGKDLVFVQTAQGFVATPVTVIGAGGGSTTVSGALKGDERVAVRGVAALKARLAGIGAQ